MAVNILRDSLLDALKDIPGTREFHLHLLVSAPRKSNGLYPFAHPRPRAYLQDILILVSEQETPDSPRLIVTAVEANVYVLPTTSCAVLYVSKVDSSGQGTRPSPTHRIVHRLVRYYADPATRPVKARHLWVHLFARAQSQYLLPNSADFEGKNPLTDVRLCAWWKRVLGEVARDMGSVKDMKSRAWYILPGYNELEALNALGAVRGDTDPWTYGHPYKQTDIPLPCPRDETHLGHFIPSFEDDPKSRFMDDIAYTTEGEVKSPIKKRPRTESSTDGSHKPISRGRTTAPPSTSQLTAQPSSESISDKDKDKPADPTVRELRKVPPGEFWERMSFRQECVAGAITGFFVLAFSCPTSALPPDDGASPLEPLPGHVAPRLNKRVITSLMTTVEFSTRERAMHATTAIESAIRGLCDGLVPASAPTSRVGAVPRPRAPLLQVPGEEGREEPIERTSTPPPPPLSIEPPSTPPRRKTALPEISPNPFAEPVATMDTYHGHIYGSIAVRNPAAVKEIAAPAPPVTVLAVRKKKKKTT
ncbi:histone acetylation protein-domain-containing protein [Schizophyllum amplum]|uniref:histone acetyltransferase n=1 Tax=Schizophyllum amplum TaxID=97359 RepID=A0A550CGN2_9AGAR|nr:histone acetylation protein-domain-containing protein [Auriculariopsis ampla]